MSELYPDKLTMNIKAIDGGVAAEIEYKNEQGDVVGYWAYGYYDPSLSYRGQPTQHTIKDHSDYVPIPTNS